MRESVPLKCPFCSNELAEVAGKSATVDVCQNCKGIWFDHGELVNIVQGLLQRDGVSPRSFRPFEKSGVQVLRVDGQGERICPRCQQHMKPLNYAYDSNIILEKCSKCEGIWADAGEAHEVARYLKEDPRARVIGEALLQMQQGDQTLKDLAELGDMLTARNVPPWLLVMPKIILPLSDDTQRHRTPLVTIAIIVFNILVFMGQVMLVKDYEAYVQRFGFTPTHFWSFGLLSSMFIHAGLLHLAGNMFFLWLFGDNVEDRFHRPGYFIFYLCCGLSAIVLHAVMNPSASLPAVGASGAISGIMGAYLVFYPAARIKAFFIYKILHIPAVLYLGTWFLFQLLWGFVTQASGVTHVAWFAHIGGFIFGGLVAYIKKKQLV